MIVDLTAIQVLPNQRGGGHLVELTQDDLAKLKSALQERNQAPLAETITQIEAAVELRTCPVRRD